MNFQERLASDPLGAICGCVIWIPIAVWTISIIHWMVSSEIEVLFGVLALGSAIGLGVLTVNPPHPGLSPLILMAVVVTVVFFPLARTAINRSALAAIDIEQMDKYYEAFLQRPDNAGAQIRLAELLYIRGMRANAIALGERALLKLPISHFRSEHQMVGSWKLQSNAMSMKPVTRCVNCGFENDPADLRCVKCGSAHIMDLARGKWFGVGAGKKLIAVWIGLMSAFVGIPLAAQFAQKSSGLALLAIVAQVIVGIVLVVTAFSKGSK